MQGILDQCRQKLGPTPRKFPLKERWSYLAIAPPAWCDKNEPLLQFFVNRENLLNEGIVVWGHLIQANQLMFRPGQDNCPGEVVYCLNPQIQVAANDLQFIAHTLFGLKGTAPDKPSLRGIADYLTDEMVRVFGLEVPTSISPLLDCAISSVFFARHHLPDGKISRSLFPILVSPQAPRYAMVVPSKYWPDQLVRWWQS